MLTPEQRRATEFRETYLAEVSHRLRARLNPLELYESVEELRQHLTAMADAHEELGVDPEAAMRESLKKFGHARRVGEGLVTAINASSNRQSLLSIPPLVLGVTMLTAFTAAICLLAIMSWTYVVLFGGEGITFAFNCQLSVAIGTIVSPMAWFLRRWAPVPFGAIVAFVMNLLLAFTIYPTTIPSIRTSVLIHFAVTSTLSMLVVGILAAMAVRRYEQRFPSRRRLSPG